jgi:hypothetical protein
MSERIRKKRMKILGIILAVVVGIITLGVLIAQIYLAADMAKTEQQSYTVIWKKENLEARYYPKALMATVQDSDGKYKSSSNKNFRVLAGYIFGGNAKKESIAMTAPVHMEFGDNGSKMSFVMPAQYNLNDLPKPQDSTIELHYSEEGYFAAIKFGGFANENIILKKQEELKQELSDLKIQMIGNFFYLGYNAPWDVINRENEVIVKIHYSEEL